MHMQHHKKSSTIMGCLDQLQRTKAHQSNLQQIYNHTCQCELQNNTLQTEPNIVSTSFRHEMSASLRMSDRLSGGKFGSYVNGGGGSGNGRHRHMRTHTHTHGYKDTHACVEREIKNNKLLELHKNSFIAMQSRKDRQIFEQNKKIVKKLLNIKSDLQQYNPSPSKNPLNLQNLQLLTQSLQPPQHPQPPCSTLPDQFHSNLLVTQTLTDLLHKNSKTRPIKSHSAVNRSRENKRIWNENKQIKDRLFSAMAKSQYSQSRIGRGVGGRDRGNMNRTFSVNFYGRGRSGPGVGGNGVRGSQRGCYQIEENQSDRVAVNSDYREKVPNQNTYYLTSYRIGSKGHKNRIKTEPQQPQPRKYSKNTLTRLFQQSIQYLQTDSYKDPKLPPQSRSPQPTLQSHPDHQSSQYHHQSSHPSASAYSPKKLQSETESMSKMRRAAMLHFRKIQKMKSTQSKFWQLTNRVGNGVGNQVGNRRGNRGDQEKMRDVGILLTQI